jgi:hypothetical protein
MIGEADDLLVVEEADVGFPAGPLPDTPEARGLTSWSPRSIPGAGRVALRRPSRLERGGGRGAEIGVGQIALEHGERSALLVCVHPSGPEKDLELADHLLALSEGHLDVLALAAALRHDIAALRHEHERPAFAYALRAKGISVAADQDPFVGFPAYFLPVIADVDHDGIDDVTLTGGYYPARTYAHDLTSAGWRGADDRPYPYGARAGCPSDRSVWVQASLQEPGLVRLVTMNGADAGTTASLFLAEGALFADAGQAAVTEGFAA